MSLFKKKSKIKFKKFESSIEASEYVAIEVLNEVKKGKKINLGLATGSTPILLYNALVSDYEETRTPWKNVSTYNLDEYLNLPEGHPQTYKEFMKKHLFSHIDINLDNTHFPKVNENYDSLIQLNGGIDIQILGIGTNGHIGFNEPGSLLKSITRVVDLTQETIDVNAKQFFAGNKDLVPKQAISMGLESILNAKKIYLLAFGYSKNEAMEKLYHAEKFDVNFPASALLQHNDVTVVFDNGTELDI
ncbi:MAG: glucosamine-6-phosphate deaminase [Mycoplasmataceae bacterium]|nr:glucosamine-6-phosphate deaminase [Mycoplasmataceae bacterium]